MFPKIEQNKFLKTKKNEIKEESFLNYTTIRKYYAVSFLIFLFFIR